MTYLYTQYDLHDFERLIRCYDERWEQLGSYYGVKALFEYLESLAEELGEPIELDVIGLCCTWAHYDSAKSAIEDYDTDAIDVDDDDSDDDIEEKALEWLRYRTMIIECDNDSILVQEF